MPKVNGIGYGEFTGLKIDHFSRIAKVHLLITQAVLNRNSSYYPQHYHYIDLTAGCGHTPNGKIGCAIAFVEQAESDNITINSSMNFLECDQDKLDELKNVLEKLKLEKGWRKSSWSFYCGKYEDLIPNLIKSKTKDFGLFFIDHSGELPDFDTLKYLALMRPKMEILIYLPSTNIKRIFPYTNKKLTDYLGSVSKKYWLIREPIRQDKHKWTFLLGTNAENLFNDYKQINLYRVDTKKGQEILRELNLTAKEKFEEDQPMLF